MTVDRELFSIQVMAVLEYTFHKREEDHYQSNVLEHKENMFAMNKRPPEKSQGQSSRWDQCGVSLI